MDLNNCLVRSMTHPMLSREVEIPSNQATEIWTEELNISEQEINTGKGGEQLSETLNRQHNRGKSPTRYLRDGRIPSNLTLSEVKSFEAITRTSKLSTPSNILPGKILI